MQQSAGGSTINYHDFAACTSPSHHQLLIPDWDFSTSQRSLFPASTRGSCLPRSYPVSDTRGPYLLPDQVFHTLTTRRQLCSTAPLAGREIQCGQMCNLGKSVDLILDLLYMLTHPTLWNQIFFSDLSKSERPHCLWVIVGRERPRQGDTITGNELQPGGRTSVAKSVTSHRCFWLPAQGYAAPIKDLKLSQIFEPQNTVSYTVVGFPNSLRF